MIVAYKRVYTVDIEIDGDDYGSHEDSCERIRSAIHTESVLSKVSMAVKKIKRKD